MKSAKPRSEFIRLYVKQRALRATKGLANLKSRVRDLLGVPNAKVHAKRIEALNGFFVARNDIVHRLDYVNAGSQSTARHTRSPADVVAECDLVLTLIADLIRGAAEVLRSK